MAALAKWIKIILIIVITIIVITIHRFSTAPWPQMVGLKDLQMSTKLHFFLWQ